MATKMEFRNDFHGTAASARVSADGMLSAAQVRRLKRQLCADGCACSGAAGVRGPGNPVIDPLPDGSAEIVLEG